MPSLTNAPRDPPCIRAFRRAFFQLVRDARLFGQGHETELRRIATAEAEARHTGLGPSVDRFYQQCPSMRAFVRAARELAE